MHPRPFSHPQDTNAQLQSAEAELEELNQQLGAFEELVDARLGSLLDQLSDLSAETAALDTQLRHIRNERLFGPEQMRYMDGAPRPGRLPDLRDLPPLGLSQRSAIHATVDELLSAGQKVPDIKTLYRKLARRYHPDLARSDADRAASNDQMTEINQAYNAGDLKALMKLAGMVLPYGVELPQTIARDGHQQGIPLSEHEKTERKLRAVREQIARMSSLPIIKLSLEVKLARHQRRDLLGEMAADLQYKVSRKLAERDYLQAQVSSSLGQ